jgi:hypothetical protein
MRNLIACKLAPLASLPAQQKYIIRATAGKYYVPEELLEDAGEAVRLIPEARDLSIQARDQFTELARLLREAKPSLTLPDFVNADPAWCALRASAQRCLDAMAFDLASWEEKELQ